MSGHVRSQRDGGRRREQDTQPMDLEQDEDGDQSEEVECSDEEDDGYGDFHRLILQSIMNAGFADGKGIKRMVMESAMMFDVQVPTHAEFYSFIQKTMGLINQKIKEFGMSIKTAVCEITGDRYYIFLADLDPAVARLRKNFSKPEVDFFQLVLHHIIKKRKDFIVTMQDCVAIANEMDVKGMTQEKTELLIRRLLELQYLTKVQKAGDKNSENDLTIGFRAIREMEGSLRELYEKEVSSCYLCKVALINGLQCPGEGCTLTIHRSCVRKYVKGSKERAQCFTCKAEWRKEKSLLVRVNNNFDKDEEEPGSGENEASDNSSD